MVTDMTLFFFKRVIVQINAIFLAIIMQLMSILNYRIFVLEIEQEYILECQRVLISGNT